MAKDSQELKEALFIASDGVIGAAVLLVVGILGGKWLDGLLHTSPWLLILLALLGGGFGLYRLVTKAMLITNSMSGPRSHLPSDWSDKTGDQSLQPACDQSSPKQHTAAQAQAKPKPPKDIDVKSAFDFLDKGDSTDS